MFMPADASSFSTSCIYHDSFCSFTTCFACIFLVISLLLEASAARSSCVSSKFVLNGQCCCPENLARRSNAACLELPVFAAHNSVARFHKMLIPRFLPWRSILVYLCMSLISRLPGAGALVLDALVSMLHTDASDPTADICSSDRVHHKSSP